MVVYDCVFVFSDYMCMLCHCYAIVFLAFPQGPFLCMKLLHLRDECVT
jgi:hypothetical protein